MFAVQGGDSLWQFHIGLHCALVRSPPSSLSLNSLPTPLKTIARDFCWIFLMFYLFIYLFIIIHMCIQCLEEISFVYEVHQPYSLTLIAFIHPPTPTSTPTHTVPILQFLLLLLISNLLFKEVSQCIPAVIILYFGLFNPFHCFPLPLCLPPPPPPFFNSFL
jgi:hypothetical protein